MKLIKLQPDHYIIVDDSEIKEGNFIYLQEGDTPATKKGGIARCEIADVNNLGVMWKKITHSTQPFKYCNCSNKGYRLDTNCAERNHCFDKIQYLSLQEVKELIGEVDVEKKAREIVINNNPFGSENFSVSTFNGLVKDITKALEDNNHKKWTDADVIHIVEKSRQTGLTAEYLLLSLQPKTEWEVKFDEHGKLKLI